MGGRGACVAETAYLLLDLVVALRKDGPDGISKDRFGDVVLVGPPPRLSAPLPPTTRVNVVLPPLEASAAGLVLDMMCWPARRPALWPAATVRLGRGAACELVLPYDDVSKYHANLQLAPDHCTIRDAGSVNGTFVNQERLPVGSTFLLKDWDRVGLGSVVLTFLWTASLVKLLSGTPKTQPPG